jgi:hypothetical protein
MNVLEEQADKAKARELHWKPLSWLGTLRPTTANDAWDQPLWETFVCTTMGLEVPVLASLPRRNQRSLALCDCKKHGMDLYGDHTSTCTAHSGATKAHDWAIGVLGPLFRSAGHVVRTQHGVTASAGQRRRPTARRRGGAALLARRSGQPEPCLRLVHHTRQNRQQLPRAAERFAIASPGP